jgi:DNA-binding NarL/FixJ family response regulator
MRVLLSDHHEASACGCEAIIREVDRDATISRVMDRRDALAIAAKHPDTDLILWHVHDQPEEDFEILRSLSQYAMGVPIIVLADKSNPDQILRALNLGVKGYIDLPVKKDQIIAILRLILAGGCYCPTSVLIDDEEPNTVIAQIGGVPAKTERRALTARQSEVRQLLTAGHTNKEIADKLGIAPATVKLHVAAVLKALDANAREDLIGLGAHQRPRSQERQMTR